MTPADRDLIAGQLEDARERRDRINRANMNKLAAVLICPFCKDHTTCDNGYSNRPGVFLCRGCGRSFYT